jgi:GNAT superfamily N-acetyltransferase
LLKETGPNADAPRVLPDGLVLRRASGDDAERLAEFNVMVHSGPDSGLRGVTASEALEYGASISAMTLDLMSGNHPTVKASDFLIVEDRSNRIVSSLVCIPQTWSYRGVPFGVMKIEAVGTRPEYRKRGLIRALFETAHSRSESRGIPVQTVSGIPYFYRQFGYELAMHWGGGRSGYRANVPTLKEGSAEPFRLRRATEGDISFISTIHRRVESRSLIACLRDEPLWAYELKGRSEKSLPRRDLEVIETTDGEPVGLLATNPFLWGGTIAALGYELAPGFSWNEVTPSVVRALWTKGTAVAQKAGQELQAFTLGLGPEHPVYEVFRSGLPRERPPYALYVRVPDLAGFIRLIAPALEGRLAESVLRGYSGELSLSFYRGGLRLSFKAGSLVNVETWVPQSAADGDARFPDLTFLQLLFGRLSLESLEAVFADCYGGGDVVRGLLRALFPQQPSNTWFLG